MKTVLFLMFVSLNAFADGAFKECFNLGYTDRPGAPARVCFNSVEQSGRIDTHEVEVFSINNSLLSKQPVKMTANTKPGVPFSEIVIQSVGGPYQISAKRLNNWLSFSYLRDLQSGEVFKEYKAKLPTPGKCNGHGHCI